MIFSVIFALFFSLPSLAQGDCQLFTEGRSHNLQCPTLAVEQFQDRSGQEQSMTILFNDGLSLTLSIFTSPRGTSSLFEIDLGDHDSAILGPQEHQELQAAIEWIYANKRVSDFMLIGFFANLPADESLEELTKASGEVPWPSDGDNKKVAPGSKKKP